MEVALCTIDNKEWNADNFLALGEKNIVTMRRNLKCISCGGDAWFRKASYGQKVPHFCAHHLEDCIAATSYELIDDGDGSGTEPTRSPDSGITLNLGTEKDYKIDIEAPEPLHHLPSGQKPSRIQLTNSNGKDFPAHLSLKNTLYKLVRSDKLYSSEIKVTIPNTPFKGLPQTANELFVNFKIVNQNLHDKNRIYWGFISDAGFTSDGRLWLNAGNRTDGLSVAINPDITDEFREYFKVKESLELLEGCHALIIGNCYIASTGKPVIWCSGLDYIVLRQYNFKAS